MKYYIGEKIVPSGWNKTARRPKKGIQYKELTTLIETVESHIKSIVLESKIKGVRIDKNSLKIELQKRLGVDVRKPVEDKVADLVSFLEMMIERRTASPRYKNSGVRNYKLLKTNLKKYSKHVGQKFNFDDITILWYYGFIDYMYNSLEASINYAASMSNKLCTVLRTAVEVDVISNNRIYENKRFKTSEIYVPKIYLSEKEILKIYNHSYEKDYLRNAVNLFTIDCLTGLRFADLKRIDLSKDIEIIDGVEVLKNINAKTNETVIIPLHKVVKTIKENHEVRQISNAKLNDYIKDAAALAGITNTIEKISYPKGNLKREYVKKYSEITVHTARRSFATNMYKKGVPARSIMMMTGHKTEKQFLKYLRLSLEENVAIVVESLKG